MIRAALMLLCLSAIMLASAARAHVYFVDYENGDDTADGMGPGTAWRHAPGDPMASGRAARSDLRPGDEVRFKGGVRYSGEIRVPASGEKGRPIVFAGAGFGEGRAIIEGADPVRSITPCQSRRLCADSENWKQLAIATLARTDDRFAILFDEQGMLSEARLPRVEPGDNPDDVKKFFEIPLSEKAAVEKGQLRAAALIRHYGARLSGHLLIWTYGNQIARRPIIGVAGDVILFPADGLKLYPDRPGRYAIIGLPAAIAGPREFAWIAPDRALVFPDARSRWLRQGSGRRGFDIGGNSHVVIRDFLFEHQSGWAGSPFQGVAIFQRTGTARNLVVHNNIIRNGALWNGAGVITIRGVEGGAITDNAITGIDRGSGIRASGSRGIVVSGNQIAAVGRTAIAFLGVADSRISGNRISDIVGVHGNGVSLYLDNRNIEVTDNRIVQSTRPITFHGDKRAKKPGNHEFLIRGNLFVTTSDGRAALTSWGQNTRGVAIIQNIAIGGKIGMLLDGGDTDVSLRGNYGNGISIKIGGAGADWIMKDNRLAGFDFDPDVDYESADFVCGRMRPGAGQKFAGIVCP